MQKDSHLQTIKICKFYHHQIYNRANLLFDCGSREKELITKFLTLITGWMGVSFSWLEKSKKVQIWGYGG